MITHRLGVMEMPNWRCLALLSAQYTHIIVEKGPKHVQVSYRELKSENLRDNSAWASASGLSRTCHI
jgi:hypothetical protein